LFEVFSCFISREKCEGKGCCFWWTGPKRFCGLEQGVRVESEPELKVLVEDLLAGDDEERN